MSRAGIIDWPFWGVKCSLHFLDVVKALKLSIELAIHMCLAM